MKSYTLNTVLSARTDKFVHHGRHTGLYLRSVNVNNILRSYDTNQEICSSCQTCFFLAKVLTT